MSLRLSVLDVLLLAINSEGTAGTELELRGVIAQTVEL